MRGLRGSLCVFTLSFSSSYCFAQNTKRTISKKPQIDVFIKLLKEFKNKKYKSWYPLLDKSELIRLSALNYSNIRLLPKNVMEPRYKQYNYSYLRNLKFLNLASKTLLKKRQDLKSIPLSDEGKVVEAEVKIGSIASQIKKTDKTMFLISIEANRSIEKSLENLSYVVKKKNQEALLAEKKRIAELSLKNIPGTRGGTLAERKMTPKEDKVFLTPVDDEFYKTQVGKKLEKDLGGKADFWSYDYGTDELYVKVGDSLGKLRVKQDGPGARFIQTRIGSRFIEPVGADEKVDNYTAKGRFLTGKEEDESLFGDINSGNAPAIVDPMQKPGSNHDGHNH